MAERKYDAWVKRQFLGALLIFGAAFALFLALTHSLARAFWLGLFTGSLATLLLIGFGQVCFPAISVRWRLRMLEGAPPVRRQTAAAVDRYLRLKVDSSGALSFSSGRVRTMGLLVICVGSAVIGLEWWALTALGLTAG